MVMKRAVVGVTWIQGVPRRTLSRKERCSAFHVASWLVALPRDEITQDHNGLSVVTLFVRYLESLDGSVDRPVDTRLARMLARVSQNILCLGDDPAGTLKPKQFV